MKVINIKQTCTAFPSQWEGKIFSGRMFHVLYRWGYITISLSNEPTDDVSDALNENGEDIYREKMGNDFDGFIKQEKVVKLMKKIGFEFKNDE